MLELLKSIDMENTSIRMIKETLEEVRKELGDYQFENECSNNTKYNLHKLQCLVDRTNIEDLNFREIKEYINKLIVLIEFILDK
ncbi:hypothetical protein ACOT7R_16350 [Clostridium perfringens]|uniref:hypothetical protein n=1 Tax=Clostridium perfringens TaxID=1502 RepID=UPI003BABD167